MKFLEANLKLAKKLAYEEVSLEDILKRATTDALTGVHNFWEMERRSSKMFQESATTGLPVSLVMIDLDNLRETNNTRGHALGDKLLQNFALFCKANLRTKQKQDFIGRIGGDEFLIIMNNTPAEKACVVMARLQIQAERLEVGFSYGIVELGDHPTVDSAKVRADDLMNFQKGQRKALVAK